MTSTANGFWDGPSEEQGHVPCDGVAVRVMTTELFEQEPCRVFGVRTGCHAAFTEQSAALLLKSGLFRQLRSRDRRDF